MNDFVYILMAVVSICCAYMLIRGYRKSKTRLLLWVCLCFTGLAISGAFLYWDSALTPEVNLYGAFVRNLLGTISGGLLLYGLIWELT